MTKTMLLQGVTEDSHLAAIKHLLEIPSPERVIVSVAFMNESGLALLEESLIPVAGRATVMAGIRNGITSAQGLRKSLEIGCITYAVDTGSRAVLFHPKVYLSRNASEARLIVGSANLTYGGLSSNIEASLLLTLGLDELEDAALVRELEGKIDGMIAEYDEHVFLVPDNAMVANLFDSGRVVDESLVVAPTPSGSSRNRGLDTVSRMDLKSRYMPRPRIMKFLDTEDTSLVPEAPVTAAAPVHERLTLVWESNPLSRRDLTIPTSAGTNPTGSMLFGRGAWDEDIDHRHYFRDTVFANLDWQFDTQPRALHTERAEARFQLIIRDVNYAVTTLRLSHNSRVDTSTYEQRNSMTRLHWGDARRLVAREDLLGRTMYLYRDEVEDGLFVLEID